MKHNELGRTGISVSALCLGTMTFGSRNTEAEAHAQMDYAIANGVNFFDTAEMYAAPPTAETQGKTEEIIGTWFNKSGKRGEVVLASKVSGDGISWIRGGAPINSASILDALNGSLKRLQTDYIDLYQLHWPNRGSYHFRKNWHFDATKQNRQEVVDNIAEVLETLDEVQKAGKIRAIGLSNESAWGTAQYLRISDERGLPRVATIQNEYNLLCRLYDLDLGELSHNEDVGLVCYSPLAAGILSGKYLGGKTPAGSRKTYSSANIGGRLTGMEEPAVQAYCDIAKKHGLDVVQMSLAWCMTRPFMASVIFGSTTMEQLKVCIGAANVTLSDAVMEDIQQVYRRYPMPI